MPGVAASTDLADGEDELQRQSDVRRRREARHGRLVNTGFGCLLRGSV